jgi:hypothetical protein
MALPENNISTTLVGNTIGNSSRNVGVLCTAPTINKWSKKKPVREHGSPNWWEATNPWLTNYHATDGGTDNFSLDMAEHRLSTNTQDCINTYDTSFWSYHRPDGTIAENAGYRLGDFRGYEHQSLPPFLLTDYPEAGGIGATIGTWTYSINTSINHILASDLNVISGTKNLGDGYFGVLVEWGTIDSQDIFTVVDRMIGTSETMIKDENTGSSISTIFGDIIGESTNYWIRWISFISTVKIYDIANDNFYKFDDAMVNVIGANGATVVVTPGVGDNDNLLTNINKGLFWYGVVYTISVSNPTLLGSAENATVDVIVTSSVPTGLSGHIYASWYTQPWGDDTAWFSVNPTNWYTTSPKTLTITAETANTSQNPRSAILRVYLAGADPAVYDDITVTQSGVQI